MASTSSQGAASTKSTTEAQHFYDAFQVQIKELQDRIEQAKTEEQIRREVMPCINSARASLTRMTESLPTYDQQTSERAMRDLSDLLTKKRAQLAPKAKFAFARKGRPVAAAALPVASDFTPPALRLPAQASPTTVSESIVARRKGEVLTDADLVGPSSSDLQLTSVEHCLIDFRQCTRALLALQLRDMRDCVVLAGRIDGSVMIHNCKRCVFVLSCRQFRMHDTHASAAFLSTSSVATIEETTGLVLAPVADDGRDDEDEDGLLGAANGHEAVVSGLPRVQDFNHINLTLARSPNWREMDSIKDRTARRQLRSIQLSDLSDVLASIIA